MPSLGKQIARALAAEDSATPPQAVLRMLQERRAALFGDHENGVVAYLTDVNGVKTARLWLTWGALPQVTALHPYIENWAKAEGCRQIEMLGRKAWGRILPDYRPVAILHRKELD